ncbi:ABC transporter ATP-binding protein [Candidatus Aerophobetes bacterium]|nr:ABC transporter ATP-binding protein [Candidatus Aerophobetes bacterium]
MSSIRLEGVVKKFYQERSFLIGKQKDSSAIYGLDHIYLDIKEGETLGVIGPTGCGKTTLLKVIAGLEKIEEGRVYFDGRDVTRVRPRERNIGMVFQTYALYPHMVSRENLAFPFRIRKLPEFLIDEKIEFTAQTLGVGFRELLGRMPRTLSQGQKQRVALGRCIIRNPSVFLLDEPLSSLDAKLRVKTRVEIKKILRRFLITTVYVTHDQSEAVALADRTAVMREGKIEQVGTFDDIYEHPATVFVAEFLGNPSMNMFRLTLGKKEGYLIMADPVSDIRIKVPREWEDKLKEKNMLGKDVIFGIRPEDTQLVEDVKSTKLDGFFTFKALIEDREVTIDNKAHLFLRVGQHRMIATVDNYRELPPVGREVIFSFPVKRGKVFNEENELALIS